MRPPTVPRLRKPFGTAATRPGLPAEDEDCLVLNVFTPSVTGGKRPVMVWLHGGGFSSGSGSSPINDGTSLAHTSDVVVVTINHRLNVLGFDLPGRGGGTGLRALRLGRNARYRRGARMGARQHRATSEAIQTW